MLWDVRNFPIAFANRRLVLLKSISEHTVGKNDKDTMKSLIREIELERDLNEDRIRQYKTSVFSISLAVALYSSAWLVFLCFYPKYEISTQWIALWSCVALAPMPILLLITLVASRKQLLSVKRLENEFIKIIQKNIKTPS
jgi:hypothetical protein